MFLLHSCLITAWSKVTDKKQFLKALFMKSDDYYGYLCVIAILNTRWLYQDVNSRLEWRDKSKNNCLHNVFMFQLQNAFHDVDWYFLAWFSLLFITIYRLLGWKKSLPVDLCEIIFTNI